jgi:hypothetical protein
MVVAALTHTDPVLHGREGRRVFGSGWASVPAGSELTGLLAPGWCAIVAFKIDARPL